MKRTIELTPAQCRNCWRAWARLQSFPDEYRFECAMAAAYRGIGNAVPPPMAQAFGREIKRHLEKGDR